MLLMPILAAAVATSTPAGSRTRAPVRSTVQRASVADSGHCLDSFLAAGQQIAPPNDVSRGVQHTRPDRVVRVDYLLAKAMKDHPIVGFLYVTEMGNVLFSTRERRSIDPRVAPLIREIFAAGSTATAPELTALLDHQNGNAVLYLRHPDFLKRLPLVAVPCVVLSRNAH